MAKGADAYHDLKARGGFADLSGRTLLRVTGADRVRYLNGQVTSDVRRLTAGHSQPACVTTAKGKLCAEVMISAAEDALLIDAEGSLRETLHPRLERYIISDDVTIEEAHGELRLLHWVPGRERSVGSLLASDWGAVPHQRTMRFGAEGIDFFIQIGEAEGRVTKMMTTVSTIDEALLEVIRIEAGIPRWGMELTEETLPPEAGLDRTHIDYHKGCYIGQEVISRLKSIGRVNRELTGFVAQENTALFAGADLFAGDGDTKPAGTLTSAAWSFALEKPIALGYLRRGSPTHDLIVRHRDSMGVEAIVTARALPFVS